ncbi:MAG: serine/threonine-protein phosphatase [Eubacteriales bacterium]|nr:serine/threonine-protein phosphatase [Eubacteriales bacterium]
MGLITASCSYPGGRPENEDAVLCLSLGSVTVAAVADGLGGHAAGAVASKTAVDTLSFNTEALLPVTQESVRRTFSAVNLAILEKQPAYGNMKSTLSLFAYDSQSLLLAHTGDTRIYYFHNGGIAYQSTDHSVSQMAVLAGEITADQIRFHADRSHVLYALGCPEEPHIEIHAVELPLQNGDAFLLCSDGFWEYVWETEMIIDLLKADSPQAWIDAMLIRLASRVQAGNDNFSAVGLIFKEDTI